MFIPETPVIQEWEWYGKNYLRSSNRNSGQLGDEWSVPEEIGIEVPAERVVEFLDEKIFAPFLDNLESVLEIGAGGGRFTEILLPKARRVLAADTSPSMIEILRRRYGDAPGVECLLLNGRDLKPIPDSSLDAVFSYDVFVHLSHQNIYVYLSEMKRVLKPGGKSVIHHANTLSPLGWRKFIRDSERNRQGLPPQGAFAFMTPGLMRELAMRAGLVVEKSITDVVRRDCVTLLHSPIGSENNS